MLSLILRIVDNQNWCDGRGRLTACSIKYWLVRGPVKTPIDGQSEEMKAI